MTRLKEQIEDEGKKKTKTVVPPKEEKGDPMMVNMRNEKARHVVWQVITQKTTYEKVGLVCTEYRSGHSLSTK